MKGKGEKIQVHSRTMRQLQKCNICLIEIPDKEERRNRRNIWSHNGWELSKINHALSHRSRKFREHQEGKLLHILLQKKKKIKKRHLGIPYSSCRKSKAQRKILNLEGKIHHTYRWTKNYSDLLVRRKKTVEGNI